MRLLPPDFSFFEKLMPHEGPWHVSLEFLFYLLLIKKFKDKVSVDYLQDRGWAEDIAKQVLAAANL